MSVLFFLFALSMKKNAQNGIFADEMERVERLKCVFYHNLITWKSETLSILL